MDSSQNKKATAWWLNKRNNRKILWKKMSASYLMKKTFF